MRADAEFLAVELYEDVGNLGWGLTADECQEIVAFILSRLEEPGRTP